MKHVGGSTMVWACFAGTRPYILHVRAHTHTNSLTQSHAYYTVVVLWFQTIRIHSYIICIYYICLLADVPNGFPPAFPTETVGCFLFGFYRYSS